MFCSNENLNWLLSAFGGQILDNCNINKIMAFIVLLCDHEITSCFWQLNAFSSKYIFCLHTTIFLRICFTYLFSTHLDIKLYVRLYVYLSTIILIFWSLNKTLSFARIALLNLFSVQSKLRKGVRFSNKKAVPTRFPSLEPKLWNHICQIRLITPIVLDFW